MKSLTRKLSYEIIIIIIIIIIIFIKSSETPKEISKVSASVSIVCNNSKGNNGKASTTVRTNNN